MKRKGFSIYPNHPIYTPLFIFFFFILFRTTAYTQKTKIVSAPDASGFATIIAGEEYHATGLRKVFLGRHYRAEWTTPVRVRVLNMDTLGGLTPTEQGGGRQTKTLRLRDVRGKEYVLRSIDKDYGGALPEITRGTFIERLAKDQVSTAHPYAAITIPMLAEAAQVYHTNPQIFLVPQSPRLGAFSEAFANTLCLFEERPDDDQSDAANFGYSKEVVSTAKMFEKIYEKNAHRVDQRAFVRARLFDIFIGDWSRHEDQWRWASFKEGSGTVYRPIPRDRDQVYTLFDGVIPYIATSPEQLEHLSTFKKEIKNIKKYNFSARHLDRQLLNAVPREVWLAEAAKLQTVLTNEVIERSIRQLPAEVFPFSGPTIIANLKQRRQDLPAYAEHYYEFLTEEVELVGTKEAERFEIKRLAGQTKVDIYSLAGGKQANTPFYSRTFTNGETEEIRFFGLAGNDIFTVDGDVTKGIKLRLIGGIDKDSITDRSHASGLQRKTLIYDNPGNMIQTTGETKVRLSRDTSINRFDYQGYTPNVGKTVKTPSFSNIRGLHLRAGYTYRRYHWRKEPFSWEQTLKANYSITNGSFGGDYEGIFNQVIGKWNLLIDGRYDQVLKHYYYGVGNDSKAATDYSFYRLQTSEGAGRIGLQRPFREHHALTVNALYENYKVLHDEGHFATATLPLTDPTVFNRKHFGGGGLTYAFSDENDAILPTKGVNGGVAVTHWRNLASGRGFQHYAANLGIHLPLGKAFSLSIRGAGTLIDGEAEFYQLPWIGGGQTLRGYRRERFRGEKAISNQNELRWMTNTRNSLFNGKFGLLAFVDNGRVWDDFDINQSWHTGVGGGVFIIPFNRFVIGVNYGISSEGRLFHFRFGKLL